MPSGAKASPPIVLEGASQLKIFISYRRDDSAATADYLYQTLQKIFTPRGVFRDIASLPFGIDFATHLRDTLSQCDVILVLIGRGWLDARDEHGNRRLDQPGDPVREEVALALQSDALVIPVLLDDVLMPRAEQLPADLAPLAQRQAAALHTDDRRTHDTRVIVAVVRAFMRRYPRQWLLGRLPFLLPLLTTITFTFAVLRPQNSQSLFGNTIMWLVTAVLWLLPLLYAARWRQWIYFRRLALPYLFFLFLTPFLLTAPSLPGAGAFVIVLLLEGLALRSFAQNVPRSLALALRMQAPAAGVSVPPAAPAQSVVGGQPASSWPRFRRWLTWGVIVLALLTILTSLAGALLAVGRDFASDAPELYWSANLQMLATYISSATLLGAVLALVMDMSEARRARRSSPWGDAASARGDGFTFSMLGVRIILIALPIAAFKIAEPFFFDRATADAAQYTIDLTLGSASFALTALLSLIPLGRRARSG